MIYGLYQSAAGMLTNEYRQGVLANNIANADTVGFKRDIPVFAERVPAAEAGLRGGPSSDLLRGLTGGMWLGRTNTDFAENSKLQTDNSLDVALDGPGFLTVAVDGQTLYTRDGRMIMRADGLLVSAADGAAVLGRGGTPIQLDPQAGSGSISIDENGTVFQDGRAAGELELVDFADYTGLKKVGAQRFAAADEQAGTRSAARVRSGYVEGSGVQPIAELVNMMEASRAYQMNAQMISLQDQTVGRLVTAMLGT